MFEYVFVNWSILIEWNDKQIAENHGGRPEPRPRRKLSDVWQANASLYNWTIAMGMDRDQFEAVWQKRAESDRFTVGRWEPDKKLDSERVIENWEGERENSSLAKRLIQHVTMRIRRKLIKVFAAMTQTSDDDVVWPMCRQHVEYVWYFVIFWQTTENRTAMIILWTSTISKSSTTLREFWEFERLDGTQRSVIYEAAISWARCNCQPRTWSWHFAKFV